MRRVRWIQILAVVVGLPLLMGQACPFFAPRGPSDTELTDEEAATIRTLVHAVAGLSQAVGVAQVTPDPEEPNGPDIDSGQVTLGACPVITLEVIPFSEGQAFVAAIDFGATPCSPETFPGLSCTGSATGSFSPAGRSIGLTLNDIGCGNTLNGSVQAGYAFSMTGVNLNGAFDLSYEVDGEVVNIDGQSSLIGYDRSAPGTTIGTFEGSISDSAASYAVDLSDVVLSYQNNANLIPSAGVVDLSGSTIRRMTLRFNADSPSAGVAEVSINGGPFFEVNVLEL